METFQQRALTLQWMQMSRKRQQGWPRVSNTQGSVGLPAVTAVPQEQLDIAASAA